jgi:small-conductance mechanosensitive channel
MIKIFYIEKLIMITNKILMFLFIISIFFLLDFTVYSQDSLVLPADSVLTTPDSGGNILLDSTKLDEFAQEEISDIKEVITSSKIIGTLLTLLIGFYLIKIITKFLHFFSEKSANYRITFKGIIPIVRILGWSIIIFFIISAIIKPPIETVIAVTASVGIAFGLAAQDILKNIFGGIMILFDRPFVVGDKIEVGNQYGEVIRIGLRSTRIVTPDDSTVSIPNSEIMNQSVSNANSGETNCQVVAEIYLPIDVNTEKVREVAVEAAQVSKYVYLNKPIVVLFTNEVNHRKSYLKMKLKAYVMDIRFEFKFKSDMTEIVIRELLKNGIIKKEDLE